MHNHRHHHSYRLSLMLTLLATTLTTSEAYAAKSSSAKPKPKPKPGATGNNLSPLEKADKIVSIGQNIFSAANAVWDGVNRTEDYAYYTPALVLVHYQDETVINRDKTRKRIVRTHWLNAKSEAEKYKTYQTNTYDDGREDMSTTDAPFPHGWGHVSSITFDNYYDPGKKCKEEITYSMTATQYKILLQLEKPPSDKIHLIDSARIIETLNYQEIQPNETYHNYCRFSSSNFIDNRPVKTETYETRSANITMESAQLISYPKVNAVTVSHDHMIHFLAPRRSVYIIAPPSEDSTENP